MKSKNANTKPKTTKTKAPSYTRQNSDLYKAFTKQKLTKAKLTLHSKVPSFKGKTSGKVKYADSQYFFKRLAGRKWTYDDKSKSFKVIGRSVFNAKTMQQHHQAIQKASRAYREYLSQQMQGELGLHADLNDEQLSVVASIYNSGLDLNEFKSKYKDDYDRLFEPDEEEF